VARGGMGQAAETYVVRRIKSLSGWDAHNANDLRANQPGVDVVAVNAAGREVRLSVKSVSTGGSRHDYTIGRSFEQYPADVYAFVDMIGGSPEAVYLAGARSVEELAMERHRKYQADRGRGSSLNSWAPKVSRGLLDAMGAWEAWGLLNDPASARKPAVTDELRERARADAPRPRGA
jgi:hypothetical protein